MAEYSVGVAVSIPSFESNSPKDETNLHDSLDIRRPSEQDGSVTENKVSQTTLDSLSTTSSLTYNHQSPHDSQRQSLYSSYSPHSVDRQPSANHSIYSNSPPSFSHSQQDGNNDTVYNNSTNNQYDSTQEVTTTATDKTADASSFSDNSHLSSAQTTSQDIPPVSSPPNDICGSPNTPEQSSSDASKSSKRLHISNIPFKYRENDLRQLFYGYGEIVDVEIIFNDRGSKGFGFITLANIDDAKKARQELNGKVVDGRKIEINEATPRTGPPKSKSLRGPWSSQPPSSSSWNRSGPYGGNYQYAGYQYHNNGGRGGYRGGGGGNNGAGGGSPQYSVQGGYGYQQPPYQQDYGHGGYNYHNYGPPSHHPPPHHQQQHWSSHQNYNYSGGYSSGGMSRGSNDYRYAPY